MVQGVKKIYAERVIFYNHCIRVRIQSDTEIHLLNEIYRWYIVIESKKYQINNLGDKCWYNEFHSNYWQMERMVTT